MQNCEHLENGKCLAFAVLSEGFKIETHVPKFCAVDVSVGGNEFDPQVRFAPRCIAANDVEDQHQCDDFKKKEEMISDWHGRAAAY